ncbi:MAG TPA: DoxX family protein [Casimicrobiaceae bacterium]|nr:DoxX family protein [Casimicrobiaceae bacterium]
MTTAPTFIARAGRVYIRAEGLMDKLQSLFALAIRLYLARVFIASALTKLHDWNITLALFENEYHVPLLSPAAAAFLGTAAELGLPILIVAGLGTRFAALALFVFNLVAATSYPDLSDAGLKDHILWGTLMLVLAVYGPGRFSLDRLLTRGQR